VTTVNKIWHTWLISLFITLLACLIGMAAVCVAARQDEELARSQALADATDRGNAVKVAIDRALSSTYALSAMVRGRG
jgi:ABC-type Fe3+ transport system permease subunit